MVGYFGMIFSLLVFITYRFCILKININPHEQAILPDEKFESLLVFTRRYPLIIPLKKQVRTQTMKAEPKGCRPVCEGFPRSHKADDNEPKRLAVKGLQRTPFIFKVKEEPLHRIPIPLKPN